MPMRILTVTGTSWSRPAEASPGGRDGVGDDGVEQVALPRQRAAAALAGDLGDGAAEVEVDVVGAVLGHEDADGRRDGGRVDAVELDRAHRLGRVRA